MSWLYHDEDEWEPTSTHRPCTGCIDGKCSGRCNASGSIGCRRRDPAEVARIKADRLRREEDEILRRADAIRSRRT